MARAGAWLLGLFAFAQAPSAHAEGASIAVRLELSGPFGCVSARELLTALQSRNGRVRLAAGDEPGALLRVRVSETARGLRGELEVRVNEAQTSARVVDGDSCRAVVEALSLSAALALQLVSQQVTAPKTAPSLSVPLDAAGAAGREASRPAPAALAKNAETRSFRLEAGAQASLAQVLTPHLNAGGSVLARARHARGLQASLSLSLLHSRNELFESSRHAALRLTGVALTACPARFYLPGPLRLEPCATGTGAELRAVGRELPSSATVSRSWWGLGALLRLSVSPASDVAIELEAGALLPLVDRQFVVLPSGVSLGKTPPLVPFANAGLVYAI